jgi:hypothetical protein
MKSASFKTTQMIRAVQSTLWLNELLDRVVGTQRNSFLVPETLNLSFFCHEQPPVFAVNLVPNYFARIITQA